MNFSHRAGSDLQRMDSDLCSQTLRAQQMLFLLLFLSSYDFNIAKISPEENIQQKWQFLTVQSTADPNRTLWRNAEVFSLKAFLTEFEWPVKVKNVLFHIIKRP